MDDGAILPSIWRKIHAVALLAVIVAAAGCMGDARFAARVTAKIHREQLTRAQIDGALHACSYCHGVGGRSVSPLFPRLAGQNADYIEAQLYAFRDHTRADPDARAYMWGMAAPLSDRVIHGLAVYYAAQLPARGTPAGANAMAAGSMIYQRGVADTVLPCMACHGAEGQGAGTTPRLAGQHRLSLRRQLGYFAAGERTGGMMNEESMNMTDRQFKDVTAYLAAQTYTNAADGSGASVTQAGVADAARVCSSCHDFGDNHVSPAFTFPRLAGQQKRYLVMQLEAFRDKRRADPRARIYMWGRAAHLDDAMIARLAAYYAAQKPAPASVQDAADVAAGKQIYQQGIPDKTPPCGTCHGANAEGAGTRPRLAGQRRLSLQRQLVYFATNARSGGMMHKESMNLTARQIENLSAYLAAR